MFRVFRVFRGFRVLGFGASPLRLEFGGVGVRGFRGLGFRVEGFRV